MTFVKEFIGQYGFEVIFGLVSALAAYIGTKIKQKWTDLMDDKTKKNVVETCVKAVEQLYSSMGGKEKLAKAKENIVDMLNVKGIKITEIEMDMLIESVVAELNFNDLRIISENKKEEITNGKDEAVG